MRISHFIDPIIGHDHRTFHQHGFKKPPVPDANKIASECGHNSTDDVQKNRFCIGLFGSIASI